MSDTASEIAHIAAASQRLRQHDGGRWESSWPGTRLGRLLGGVNSELKLEMPSCAATNMANSRQSAERGDPIAGITA